jgi:hypothetical protein
MAVITLSPSANDIIMNSVDRIENFDPNYYPDADNIAIYVNETLPPDETLTIEDIDLASAVLVRKYPDLLGYVDEIQTISELINAFKSALSKRIVVQSYNSLLKAAVLIFTAYLIFGFNKKGK